MGDVVGLAVAGAFGAAVDAAALVPGFFGGGPADEAADAAEPAEADAAGSPEALALALDSPERRATVIFLITGGVFGRSPFSVSTEAMA